jgi:Protein of unknown function (DUF3489)
MFNKLSNTQLSALSAAAQRDDRCLVPPPKLKGGARKAFAAKLIAGGLAREVRAKEPAAIWRTDATTGRTYALKVTAKGKIAVTESEREADIDTTNAAERSGAAPTAKAGKGPPVRFQAAPPADANGDDARNSRNRPEPRANSKLALLVDLLSRDRGATIADLTTATGWLPHTTRAALTGLRKRGFGLARLKGETGGASIYRVAAGRSRDHGATR